MATLVVPWYQSSSERHNSELLGALFSNLSCPGVSRILLVSETDPPPVRHEKLEFVSVKGRPTFWDLFDLVQGEGPFAVVNADCAVQDARFVDTLEGLECLWVTRWDVNYGAPLPDRYKLSWGADLFGFPSVPAKLPREPWAPGEVYCDRVLGVALVEAGYQVRNLPWAVPVVHLHARRVRDEDENRPSSGTFRAFSIVPTADHRSPLWSEPFCARVP